MTTGSVLVAVCTRAYAPTLERCLAALHAAGAQPLVFRATSGHGLSAPRNAALDAARRFPVVAFVDDDVIVPPDWLQAIVNAWQAAADGCACIGGRLDTAFASARPKWLTDAFLGVLGAGPSGSTFRGGNVSFRVDALRGIGGFWPAVGDPDLRDWFSEEHYAQHQLASVGWFSQEAPTAAATRLVDPDKVGRASLLARRARYGARMALIGAPQPRATAARAAVVSALGVAAAFARGDEAIAMERAGRAFENGGRLLAAPLASRALQPDRRETPFLYAVPQSEPRMVLRRYVARARRPTPLVLVYHRVDDAPGADVDPETFAKQVSLLISRRTPVAVDEIARGTAPADAVALTFDDGYAETLPTVKEVLNSAGVPATVYVVTARAEDQVPFWWDELEELVGRRPGAALRLSVDGETRAWADGSVAQAHIRLWLCPKSPESISRAIEELRTWAGADGPVCSSVRRPATVDELRAASSPLISFGAHSRTHCNLRFASPRRRQLELTECRADLEHWLGFAPTGFAYPFGLLGVDIDHPTRDAAEAAGFQYAVTNRSGPIESTTDRFALPRVAPPNSSDRAFAALL